MTSQDKESISGQSEKQFVYVSPCTSMDQSQDDEIDLLELWRILWRGKWFIMGFTLLATLYAVYHTLFVMPEVFRASAVLMPTEQQSARANIPSIARSLMPDLVGDTRRAPIMTFLMSRTLEQRLIEKYDLLPRYNPDLWDEEKKQWIAENPGEEPTLVRALQSGLIRNVFEVSQDRDSGLITISWADQEPEFTPIMLERVIHELEEFLVNEHETNAQREREFVEQQLAQATRELEYWEQQVPGPNLTQSKIQRERAVSQDVYAELRKQLELARINEAKEVVSFKLLDHPFIPEQRFSPARTMICAVTIVASGMLSVFLVFFFHFVNQMRKRSREADEKI